MKPAIFGYILKIAIRYLGHRKFATIVSVCAVSASLAFIVCAGLIGFAFKRTAVEGSIRYPLVVGPEGASAVQLVMSTIFNIDKPSGLIDYSVYEKLKADKRVSAAFPLALADSIMNYPILGTTSEFVAELVGEGSQGNFDISRLGDAVLGNEVAYRLDMRIGDKFVGSHGLTGGEDAHAHDDFEYTVVGILAPAGGPEDIAAYVSYKCVWEIHKEGHHHHPHHGHHHKDKGLEERDCEADGAHKHHDTQKHAEEHKADKHQEEQKPSEHARGTMEKDKYHLSEGKLTAVLARTKNPVYTAALEREWTLASGTQAVDTGRTIRRLVSYLDKGERLVELFGAIILFVAAMMILVTLVMSVNERRKELALMRSLGIGRGAISLIVMCEAFMITFIGCALGAVAGHLIAFYGAPYIKGTLGVSLEPFVITELEKWGIAVTLIAGQALALAGMLWTYRLNPVEEIAKE